MLDRVIANPERILIVMIAACLLIVIATWIVEDIYVKKNIKVVNQ